MRGRIEYRFLCASQADAQWVADYINGRIVTRSRYSDDLEPERPAAPALIRDGWTCIGMSRFTTVGDEQTVLADITSTWNGGQFGRRTLPGSWVEVHACPHDEPVPVACPEPTRAVK